jgi:ATP/maltotriose-dependent transcriptional regulator MalT
MSTPSPAPDRPGTGPRTQSPRKAALIPTVATKLLIPPPSRHLIERERLYDTLDEGVRGGIVLLSAPAGAGKTVLLSAWIAARALPGPACWLSLDGEDNDVNRLLANLLSALRTTEALEPGGTLDDLVAPAGAGTERFLALLVNALAELRSPLVLVLDEIHELTSAPAAAAIDFLVRHAPAQLRVVLAGRADPPLPTERLRAGDTLTELRIAELAFNREETAELCEQLELGLSSKEIDSLWARTEGWPAAMRLAALSLRGHSEPGRFLAEFAGTDRAVADYLIAEVLAHLLGRRAQPRAGGRTDRARGWHAAAHGARAPRGPGAANRCRWPLVSLPPTVRGAVARPPAPRPSAGDPPLAPSRCALVCGAGAGDARNPPRARG